MNSRGDLRLGGRRPVEMRAAVAVILMALFPFLPANSGPAHAQASGTTVRMADFAFDPVRLEVPLGSTVTWVYEDMQCDLFGPLCPGHDSRAEVTGANGQPLWHTETIKGQGMTVRATMTQLGEIPYICTLHQGGLTDMDATIVVVPTQSSATTPAPPAAGSGATAPAPEGSGGERLPATGQLPISVVGFVAAVVACALRIVMRSAHAPRR